MAKKRVAKRDAQGFLQVKQEIEVNMATSSFDQIINAKMKLIKASKR